MNFTAGQSKPCAGCPWIVGNESRSCGVAGRHQRAAGAFSRLDGFYTVMECHTLPAGVKGACIGYLLSEHAMDNLWVRLAIIEGWFHPDTISSTVEMHARYEPMAAALLDHWGFV